MPIQHTSNQLEQHLSFLKQDENNLSLLIKVSSLYLEHNDLEQAQFYLDKAKAIDHEACLAHQGFLYLNQGMIPQAKECLTDALNNFETPNLRYNLGFTYFVNDEIENAIKTLTPLVEDGHYSDANLLMARILHRQDSMDEAVDLVTSVLKNDPDNAAALGLLSLLYFDLQEETAANATSLRALELDADNYDAKLVNIMMRLMIQETTVEEVEALLALSPRDSRLWFALGTTHMVQGDFNSAEKVLKKSIEMCPGFYDGYISLAWCQLINNRLDEARQSYQKAAELADELAEAWGGLALVHALNEDLPKAEQLIHKANSLDSECFLANIAQSIYFNHKNPDKAKKHLIEALKSNTMPINEKLALFIDGL